MDREEIRKKIVDILEKWTPIYWSIIMEYNTIILKEPDKDLAEISKESLPNISRKELEKALDASLENVPEEKIENVLKIVSQDVLKDYAKKIKYPKNAYYAWYDEALEIVRILRPRKSAEFEELYTGKKYVKKTEDLDAMTAGTKHYIEGWCIIKNGEKIDFFDTFQSGFQAQRRILKAIFENFDNPLFNLERDIHLEIYKSEMDIAKDLEKQGNLRTAGAIASVILEVHLKKLAVKHGIKDKETNSIADYNSFLKGKGVYDNILADQIKPCRKIRNKCVHTNQGDPTAGEVSSIIHIADRLTNEYN